MSVEWAVVGLDRGVGDGGGGSCRCRWCGW